MNAKEARRQAAIKRAKKKKAIATGIFVIAFIAVAASITVGMLQQRGERVFVAGRQQVVLRRDGSFSASLPHNVRLYGTFTEVTEGDFTTLVFTHAGRTEFGSIVGNVLTIPSEWDDGCGHPRTYTLR